jgi:hypothetical protein
LDRSGELRLVQLADARKVEGVRLAGAARRPRRDGQPHLPPVLDLAPRGAAATWAVRRVKVFEDHAFELVSARDAAHVVESLDP